MDNYHDFFGESCTCICPITKNKSDVANHDDNVIEVEQYDLSVTQQRVVRRLQLV